MTRRGLLAVLIAIGSQSASAQIYEWRDANGSRHYTNAAEDIPEAQREAARVVVRAEPVKVASANVEGHAESEREQRRRERRERFGRYPREPVREAQIVYDNSFRFTRPAPVAEPPVPAVNINIDGPLAVSHVVVPPPPPELVVDDPYSPLFYQWPVATSFDRGRSRHRTLRMRLQEQFHLDRNGPYTYIAGPFPAGPRFQTPLPRGLRSCNLPPRRPVLRR